MSLVTYKCFYTCAAVFILLPALTIYTTVQTRPADVQGWLDSKWGMTAEDLRKTFGASLEQVPKGDYFVRNDDTRYGYTAFLIKDFDLVDGKFIVKLVADIKTDLLTEVYIAPADNISSEVQPLLFNRLAAALAQKYGQPDYSNEDKLSRERKWFFQTTTIELTLIQSPAFSLLRLTYKPTKKEKV